MENSEDNNAYFRTILPGKWQNEENSEDELSVSIDDKNAGIDIDLSKSKNELLISSGYKGSIHLSYDGGPLTHNSSITGKDLRINILTKNSFLFYVEIIKPSNLLKYKKIN